MGIESARRHGLIGFTESLSWVEKMTKMLNVASRKKNVGMPYFERKKGQSCSGPAKEEFCNKCPSNSC